MGALRASERAVVSASRRRTAAFFVFTTVLALANALLLSPPALAQTPLRDFGEPVTSAQIRSFNTRLKLLGVLDGRFNCAHLTAFLHALQGIEEDANMAWVSARSRDQTYVRKAVERVIHEIELTRRWMLEQCRDPQAAPKGKGGPIRSAKGKKKADPKQALLRSPESEESPINRSGPYVAVGVRELSGETRVTEDLGGVRTFTSHPSDRALGITGELGYVWALDHSWFASVAVSYTATSLSMLHVFPNGSSLGTQMNGYVAATGQVGYWATAQLALFAEAGAAVARQRLEVNFAPTLSKSELVSGFLFGAGVKYRPIGWPVLLSFRFNRMKFGSIDGAPAGSPFRYENRTTINSYRASVELPLPVR